MAGTVTGAGGVDINTNSDLTTINMTALLLIRWILTVIVI